MSATFLGVNPESVAVTSYVPGGSDGNRYAPLASDVVDWTPTTCGLRASTVAPGRTAPDTSFTTPSIDPFVSCARAPVATDSTSARAPSKQAYFFILDSSTEILPSFRWWQGFYAGEEA